MLDAGCGMGRYLRIAAESPATLIVGLDLSLAVVAARELTSTLSRVAVVRGDLLKLPFAPGSFDHIYSLGVLDHTPDPRAAFLGLARLLKPGGRIAIWVYPRQRAVVESIMNAQRAVSTRLPVGLLEVPLSPVEPGRCPQAKTDVQPMAGGRATRRGPPSGDHRRLDAPRPRGPHLRHPRLVRSQVPFAPQLRRSQPLVRRGRAR